MLEYYFRESAVVCEYFIEFKFGSPASILYFFQFQSYLKDFLGSDC